MKMGPAEKESTPIAKASMFAAAVGAGVAADLLSKAWARAALGDGSSLDFLPIVSLRLAFNNGVSFGIFGVDDVAGLYVLLAATAILSVVVSVLAWRGKSAIERLAFCFVASGAWANLVDRAWFGVVTDFLDMHFGSWHPFVFNLADVWISLGVCLLLAVQLFRQQASASTEIGPDR